MLVKNDILLFELNHKTATVYAIYDSAVCRRHVSKPIAAVTVYPIYNDSAVCHRQVSKSIAAATVYPIYNDSAVCQRQVSKSIAAATVYPFYNNYAGCRKHISMPIAAATVSAIHDSAVCCGQISMIANQACNTDKNTNTVFLSIDVKNKYIDFLSFTVKIKADKIYVVKHYTPTGRVLHVLELRLYFVYAHKTQNPLRKQVKGRRNSGKCTDGQIYTQSIFSCDAFKLQLYFMYAQQNIPSVRTVRNTQILTVNTVTTGSQF